MSPILYDKNATDFFNLGVGVLSEATECFVDEERNGVFELEMRYPVNGSLFDLLENDAIIKADAGHELKNQLFRIKNITKDDTGLAKIYAQHVSYLTQDLMTRPQMHFSGTAHNALTAWSNAIIDPHPFTVHSDITTVNSTSLHIRDVQNARQILGGVRGSILDVWGGEYRFDNYDISLLINRGGYANTLISYGRNLKTLEQEECIESTFTSIMPFAIHQDGDEERLVFVDGYIVDSQHVSKYPNRRIQVRDFSDEFGENQVPTPERLRTLTEQFIVANDVGVPRVNLRISFVDLTKSLNASGIPYEKLNLCDIVPVYFEELGIRTRAKIIRIRWDVLLEQYDNLEIGDARITLSNRIAEVEQNIREVANDANHALQSANGRNTVFHGPAEPTANRIGDLWYRPNGDDIELLRWNGTAWEFVLSTAPDERILEKIEDVLSVAQEAFDAVEPLVNMTDPETGQTTTVAAIALGLQVSVSNLTTEVQSQVTILEDAINLRVREGDIINQINISPEQILIAGQRIHISGQTTIDEAVIADAHILNLDAAKLTSGFVNAGRIQAGTITADHLAANTIQVGFNNMGNTLHLSATAITFNEGGTRAGMLTGNGLQFWHGTRHIMNIMPTHAPGNTNVRGVSIQAGSGGDFLFIGLPAVGTGNPIPLMVFDPYGRFSTAAPGSPTYEGIYISQVRLHVGQMGTILGNGRFGFHGTNHPTLGQVVVMANETVNRSGFWFGNNAAGVFLNNFFYRFTGLQRV